MRINITKEEANFILAKCGEVTVYSYEDQEEGKFQIMIEKLQNKLNNV